MKKRTKRTTPLKPTQWASFARVFREARVRVCRRRSSDPNVASFGRAVSEEAWKRLKKIGVVVRRDGVVCVQAGAKL